MIDSIKFIYLISNVFGTYIIFKFMGIFFERNDINKKLEIISYILYDIIISIIFLTYSSPALNLICNVIMFFILTFNYPSSLKQRITATILIYVILAMVETFLLLTTSFIHLNIFSVDADMQIIETLISSKIISYIIVLALSNFKIIKESINISLINWLSIIIIPIGTLISTILLITNSNESNLLLIIISVFLLFLINIYVFYLYDSLIKTYNEKIERELLLQQNNAYNRQFKLIEQSQENMKLFRHDVKNHINSLQDLIEKNENEGALNYLKNIYDYVNHSDEYARSGNAAIDSILNYKINEAVKEDIKVNLTLNIPNNLNIQPFDLSVVLGNLLDNAIWCASKVNGNKEISVSIEYERNIIYISISNPYEGKLSFENDRLETTHSDTKNHGFGLKSARKSIDKYNGAFDIHYTDSMFYVDVLIYNPNRMK